ncbi:MAG: two-component sensor histidine kinase [Desulfobacteraceae bacterium]|nr:two-component sensor histidine kinase [Desulfobacteraceae bacterium]
MKEKDQHYAAMKRILLASMILLPVVPFILALWIGHYHFTSALENSTIASITRIVEDHRHMIDSFLAERRSDLEFVLNTHSYESLGRPETLKRALALLQQSSSAFVDLGVFDQSGMHVAYQGPFELKWKSYRDEPWFKAVMEKGVYISDIFLGYRKVPHFVIALAKQDGASRWVIRATIDTQMFNELAGRVRIGKTGEAFLLSAQGTFQTERRSGGRLMAQDPDFGWYPVEDQRVRIFIESDRQGDTYLYATTRLTNKNWLLVVRQEKADAFKALSTATHLILLISLLGGAVIIAVAFYLTDRIVARIQQTDREKNQLNEQLIRAHRLSELGEMAAGFAHEINNPLQVMKSEQALIETIIADLKASGQLPESEDLKDLEDSVSQISLQIARCSKITHAILRFGRKSEDAVQDFDIQTFIPEVIEMVAKKASVEGIAIHREIQDGPVFIHGDPSQLQQVLLNLFNNAMDAIIARHGTMGGELTVSSAPTGNGRVRITVNDNGCGIDAGNLDKIFSPFFTTKPVGKGTGLGLSVCYGIIQNLGGAMTVQSAPGEGATFVIDLPTTAA